MSLLVDDNVVVSIHYTLSDRDGKVLDSSEGADPLHYLHGAGNIIPGLEKALAGKTSGDSLQVSVAAQEAYGEINPELLQVVPRTAFQGVESVEEGMAFEAQGPDGRSQRMVVVSIEGDNVTVDANHPLAGEQLHFDVEITSVRQATEEEIAHGHVH